MNGLQEISIPINEEAKKIRPSATGDRVILASKEEKRSS